jgi:diamine N-acetyltransferase
LSHEWVRHQYKKTFPSMKLINMDKGIQNNYPQIAKARPTRSIIRQGISADAECLAVLATQVWLHTYATDGISAVIARYVSDELSVSKFAAILTQENSTVLIAEMDAHTVGYALVNVDAPCPSGSPTVEVASLYVQEHFARQGIGSALLRECQQIAQQRTGRADYWLMVNAENLPAIAFYAKQGLVKTGTAYFELSGGKHENHVMVSSPT